MINRREPGWSRSAPSSYLPGSHCFQTQKKECRKFAAEKGWTIVMEEQEEGVSGHKVRAANRDKLQLIKEAATRGEFDILLAFTFDRIGRIADETPFVVE